MPQNIGVRNIGVQWLHGLIAPTCGRPFAFGAKLGYEVTLVRRCDVLSARAHARRPRRQHPELCQRHCHHKRSSRTDFSSPNARNECVHGGSGVRLRAAFAQSAMTAGSAGTGRHRSLSSRPTMRGRLFRAFRSGLGPTKQVPFEMQVLRALMTVSPPVWSSRCGQAVSLIAFDAYCVPC